MYGHGDLDDALDDAIDDAGARGRDEGGYAGADVLDTGHAGLEVEVLCIVVAIPSHRSVLGGCG